MFNHQVSLRITLLLCLFLTIFSCTSHKGLSPVHPDHGATIETLQPQFEWEESDQKDVTYDLAVFESDKDPQGGPAKGEELIERVLYREDIKETTYQFEKKLEPNKVYYWSVRIRKGDKVGTWSTVQKQVFTGLTYHRRTRNFTFTTPETSTTSP